MFVRVRHNEADPKSDKRFYVHEIVFQKWVENEEASPFKTGSDPEVFRGKKSGGTGFYLSLARRALAVNPESVSKVVDANGEPLVLYHGTSSDFDTFEMSKFGQTDSGWYGEGFYFTGRKEQAESYAKSSAARTKGTPRIVQAFLNIRDPFVTDRVGAHPDESEKGDGTIYYGYALFAPKSVWKAGVTVEDVLRSVAVGELLPGGQYSTLWREWLEEEKIKPRVAVRMPSFVHLARMTRETGLAAVLPEIAAVDFDPKKIVGKPMPWKHDRQIVLIANPRSLDRSGIRPGAVERLADAVRLG